MCSVEGKSKVQVKPPPIPCLCSSFVHKLFSGRVHRKPVMVVPWEEDEWGQGVGQGEG